MNTHNHARCRVKSFFTKAIFIGSVGAVYLSSVAFILLINNQSFLSQWQQRGWDTEFLIGIAAIPLPFVVLIVSLIVGYYSNNYAVNRFFSHSWRGDWKYEAEGACLQRRECKYCGYGDSRTDHLWEEWKYQNETDCTQERRCKRCQEVVTRTEHDWSIWYALEDKIDIRERECHRCKAKETDWTEWALLVP